MPLEIIRGLYFTDIEFGQMADIVPLIEKAKTKKEYTKACNIILSYIKSLAKVKLVSLPEGEIFIFSISREVKCNTFPSEVVYIVRMGVNEHG